MQILCYKRQQFSITTRELRHLFYHSIWFFFCFGGFGYHFFQFSNIFTVQLFITFHIGNRNIHFGLCQFILRFQFFFIRHFLVFLNDRCSKLNGALQRRGRRSFNQRLNFLFLYLGLWQLCHLHNYCCLFFNFSELK